MQNIYQSIAAIMGESYTIGKGKISQQGFRYRGIDDVMNTFQPLLSKHHVFLVPEVIENTRQDVTNSKGTVLHYSIMKVKFTFFAEDGSSVSAVVIGEGMDSGDKASNKAMAIAMKYAMFQVFCIPTEEMSDPDAESPDMIGSRHTKAEPAAEPVKLICECCGNEIQNARKRDGSPWSAMDIAQYTKLKLGKSMCYTCAKTASK